MANNSSYEKYYGKIGVIDFHNDKKQLILSYIIRIICIPFFGSLFVLIALKIDVDIPVTKEAFLGIAIPGLSTFFSILFIIMAILLVLYLHELIHSSIFFFSKGQKPRIGMKALVIYAKAPKHLIKRNIMIVNELAPFFVLTLLGFILIALLPVPALPWIFIPTLVNAAAAGGDFMIVMWMLGHTRKTLYKDEGGIITAFSPLNVHHLN